MGTTDWHSPLSPPSFTGRVEATGRSPVSEELDGGNAKPVDEVSFSPGLLTCNASDGTTTTTDDDSSHVTLASTASVNKVSDCDCVQSNESKATTSASFPSIVALTDDVAPNDFDRLLLKELQELSSTDRNKVQEEIHGVFSFAIDEDDEKISNGLMKLEEEIRSIRREVSISADGLSSAGYTYEESIWSFLGVDEDHLLSSLTNEKRLLYSYIFDDSFRLRFLRADLFDARKAAHRYLRCLECLLKYYGSVALQRPLMYQDLGKECQDAIKLGFVQILPSRDRAGRLVVVCQAAPKEISLSTIIKLFIYVFQVVSEDIETQKRGVIFILSTDEDTLGLLSDPHAKEEYGLYREACMVRRSCTHFCMPEKNHKMAHVRSMMMMAMSREERYRTRIYMDGKYRVSCLYDLLSTSLKVISHVLLSPLLFISTFQG